MFHNVNGTIGSQVYELSQWEFGSFVKTTTNENSLTWQIWVKRKTFDRKVNFQHHRLQVDDKMQFDAKDLEKGERKKHKQLLFAHYSSELSHLG